MNHDTSAEPLLAAFTTQIRLPDRDAAPSDVSERDGLVRRTYPADPGEPGG